MIPGTNLFTSHFPLLGPFFVPPGFVPPFIMPRRLGVNPSPLVRQEIHERVEDMWYSNTCQQVQKLARLIRRRERYMTAQLLYEFVSLCQAGFMPAGSRHGSLTYKVIKLLATNLCDKASLHVLLNLSEVKGRRANAELIEKRLSELEDAEAA